MSLLNRTFGLAEYGLYHLALEKLGPIYEDSVLAPIVFGITGALAFSEFVSRTGFNQWTYTMWNDFRNNKDEGPLNLEDTLNSD